MVRLRPLAIFIVLMFAVPNVMATFVQQGDTPYATHPNYPQRYCLIVYNDGAGDEICRMEGNVTYASRITIQMTGESTAKVGVRIIDPDPCCDLIQIGYGECETMIAKKCQFTFPEQNDFVDIVAVTTASVSYATILITVERDNIPTPGWLQDPCFMNCD